MSRISDLAKKYGTPEQLEKWGKKEEPVQIIPFTKKREDLPINEYRFLAHFIRTGMQIVGGDYKLGSDENKERLRKLVLLFNSEEPFNKFLVIAGKHGTGKTTIVTILARMLYGRPQGFSVQHSNRLNDYALNSGYYKGLGHLENGRLCINDFGYEDAQLKHYGNELNALDKLVYNRWEMHGQATFFTTNLMTKEDFLKNFSKRTVERIQNEMLFVTFNETDYRSKK